MVAAELGGQVDAAVGYPRVADAFLQGPPLLFRRQLICSRGGMFNPVLFALFEQIGNGVAGYAVTQGDGGGGWNSAVATIPVSASNAPASASSASNMASLSSWRSRL